jgi:hypothetical protein
MVSVVEDDDGVIWGSKSGPSALVENNDGAAARPNGVCVPHAGGTTASLDEPMGLASRSSELRRGTGEDAREGWIQAGDKPPPGTAALSNDILGMFKLGGGGGGASGGRRHFCKNSTLLLLLHVLPPLLLVVLPPTLSLSAGSSGSGGGIRGESVWRTVVALATLPVLGLVARNDVAPSRKYDLHSAVISGDELAKMETMRG